MSEIDELSQQEDAMLSYLQAEVSGMMRSRLYLCDSPIERLLLLALCTYGDWEFVPWPDDFTPHKEAVGVKGRDGFMISSDPFADISQHQSAADIERVRAVLGKKSDEFGFAFAAVGRTGGSSYILSQVEIPKTPFRCDFVLIDPFDTAVIIETDGHDFHERTKEQAARDRERDRILGMQGWPVLRFTGSEIWKDPRRCAKQARIFVAIERERRRGTPKNLRRR